MNLRDGVAVEPRLSAAALFRREVHLRSRECNAGLQEVIGTCSCKIQRIHRKFMSKDYFKF